MFRDRWGASALMLGYGLVIAGLAGSVGEPWTFALCLPHLIAWQYLRMERV